MKKDNVKVCTSPSLKNVGVAGSITITISNFEPYPISEVRVAVEASKEILNISPKNQITPSIAPKCSHDFTFTAIPKTSKISFAVTYWYKCNGRSLIYTSDHIIQI